MREDSWIVLVVAIPMGAAILSTLMRGWLGAQRFIGVASLLSIVAIAAVALWNIASAGEALPGGALVSQMGAWPAPFGITVAIDRLSGVLLLAAGFVALCCYVHGFGSLRKRVEARWYHPLVQLLIMGVNYAFLTGDLFNLFVAFEIMLMSSYALLVLGGSGRAISQAHKYVMLNLVGSTVFVLAAGLMYGIAGTLNYADLAVFAAVHANNPPPGFWPVAVMLLFVFAFKAAVFPLWFWLPDTYHTCPVAVGAMFAGLLTKVGVYAMCRLLPTVLAVPGIGLESATGGGILTGMLAVSAGVTMLVSICMALGASEIRRALSLMLISHIGYLVFGVAMLTPTAIAGSIFYMVQHMLVMASLFLCCGLVERIGGTDNIREIGGLHRKAPWLSVLFLIGGLSLAGVPPLSGFFGKVLIFREGFDPAQGNWWILSVAGLLTSVVTLVVVIKLWVGVFWSTPQTPDSVSHDPSAVASTGKVAPAYIGVSCLVVGSVAMAIFAEPGLRFANLAAESLRSPSGYVNAVLGENAWEQGMGLAEKSEPPASLKTVAHHEEVHAAHDRQEATP